MNRLQIAQHILSERPIIAIGCAVLALGSFSACRSTVDNASGASTPLPRIEQGTGLLFTFFDNSAQMRTVDQLADIPRSARSAVMLTSMDRALPEDQIFVADLSRKDQRGQYDVWIEQRGEWLDRVMPRASVAKLTRPTARIHRARRVVARRSMSAATPPSSPNPPAAAQVSSSSSPSQETPKVVMFSTSWCPSCRHARQFFTEKQVQFVDLDVESNTAAAERMVAIQRAQGMQVGSVPLIVIGNRAYQGFSRLQIEGALAQL